ncbi:MAG: T9SS type A sorting domain-containing protein [Candidatus Eisenbacteria bacterium]|nr:T9SS type A sorting domain-containing protein [Candidatus Eisenbacteria bacterium]
MQSQMPEQREIGMSRIAALFATLAILLVGSTAGAGSFVSLDASQERPASDAILQLQVSEGPGDAIRLQYEISGFEVTPISIQGQTYQQIRIGEEAHLLEAGVPELPSVSRSVIIPDRERMQVRVVSTSYQEFSGYDVAPSKGNLSRAIDPASVPYEFGPVYEQDAWYPADVATHGEPYILRDYRGMVVTFHPVQFNPATHTLRVHDQITIELVPSGLDTANILDRAAPPAAVVSEFHELYGDHFVNFGNDRYNPIPEVGEMLIICYDSWLAEMQPLVDWKNQMGVPTSLVPKADVGTSYSQFQSYIQDAYDASDLAFVLLVGDNAQIPSPYNDGAPADPIYSLVAGGDNYPDIFIGRFSAENASQVVLQVEKTVEYESLPAAGADWYHRGVGIGSGEGYGIGDDGEADWQHMENIRADLLNFTYTGVDSIYDHYPWQANATMVANAVNDGRTIINYCGHGWTQGWSTTGFSNSHINALTNYNKLPWIVSVACVNGAFQSGTCFAEAWMRATRDGEPTGAVAVYASTVNMSWAPPMAAQDETVDLLCAEQKRTLGALCYSGSCQMMDEYGYGGVGEFKNWHIFGDPSLRVRSDTPEALTVVHEDYIEPDATSFPVSVPGIEGALCGLSYDGDFYGSAFTDGSGEAEIAIAGTLPEDVEMTLTVTYFNSMPYVALIEVGQQLLPTLLVEPLEFVFDMPLDETETQQLSITNVGMEGSMLEYTLTVSPVSPDMWLTVAPRNGNCEYEETDLIDVTCDTGGLEIGIHEAKIVVMSNAGPPVTIPVTLYAGGYAGAGDRVIPAALSLQAAGPSPFSTHTRVRFGLPQASAVQLGVYDMSGRLVRTLQSGSMSAGFHAVDWDGCDATAFSVPAGVYFYRLDIAGQSLTDKVMKLR